MTFVAIALLIIMPIYYVAISKGYNPKIFIWPPILCSALIYAAAFMLPSNMPGTTTYVAYAQGFPILPPLIALLTVTLMKTRDGAPGKAYLSIAVQCPHCHNHVQFPRAREGLADECPNCGEILTVHSVNAPPPLSTIELPPQTAETTIDNDLDPDDDRVFDPSDSIVIRTFLNEHVADLARMALESEGIAAFVQGDTGSGALPMLSGSSGILLLVNKTDHERAEALLTKLEEGTHC